ncbi:MAG: hypothetical protein AABW50_00740 [Nanoarchaeota archaeon]
MIKDGLVRRKNAQVTIFVIIALVIIAAGILIYVFYPQITGFGTSESPQTFIQACLQEEVQKSVDIISTSGGSISPEHYILYQGDRIEYLCYINEYYLPCVVQQPLLKNHIEKEIDEEIRQEVQDCFKQLQKDYESKGYNVKISGGAYETELLPKRIVVNFDRTLTLTKDSSENYDGFRVILNNNLYELSAIANSIIEWETRYGDAETTLYMSYYPDLKVEKKQQIDGSTIYILTDRNNENKFQFASRSIAWPPGYGG